MSIKEIGEAISKEHELSKILGKEIAGTFVNTVIGICTSSEDGKCHVKNLGTFTVVDRQFKFQLKSA